MPASEGGLPEVYLQPGDSHLATVPTMLRTLLGSCVGVAFWVPGTGIGGLCHPMLPRLPSRADPNGLHSGRYVDFAIHEMAGRLELLGIRRGQVQVKLFGGADVLQVGAMNGRPTVGRMNQDAATEVLADMSFEVVAARLGGDHGVHISFHTGTGEVKLRRLNGSGPPGRRGVAGREPERDG